MDWEDLQEELQPILEPLAANKGKIILLLLILAGVYYYVYLLAKPGTATIRVFELDGGPLNDAEVTIEDAGKVLATELTSGGVASFTNLPSQKQLALIVEKGGAFESEETTIEIPSAGQASTTVKLERRNSLAFVAHNIPSSIPIGCADEFQLEVKNNGRDAFETALVAEEELAPLFSFPDEKKAIPSGGTANFTLKASVLEDKTKSESENLGPKAGAIRLKRTNRALALTIIVNPKIRVDASPSEIFHSQNKPQKALVTFSNTGDQTISGMNFEFTGDADLKAACGQGLENCLSIERLGALSEQELRPGDKIIIGLIITPPNAPGKKFLASLRFSGYCFRKSPVVVPIRIELEEAR